MQSRACFILQFFQAEGERDTDEIDARHVFFFSKKSSLGSVDLFESFVP